MLFWQTMAYREQRVLCSKEIISTYAMQMPYYLVPTINSTDASSETASGGYYVLAPYAQGIQTIWMMYVTQ